MSFSIKSWVDRAAQFPLRRQLTKLSEGIDGNNNPTYVMDVVRAEGTVSTEGDAFSAENMNNLESRIQSAFNDDATLIADATTKLNHAFQDLGDAHTNWGNTAQRAISTGNYIVYGPNQQFAQANSAIAQGETFNAGTGGNVTNLSVGSVLSQLNTGISQLNSALANLLTWKFIDRYDISTSQTTKTDVIPRSAYEILVSVGSKNQQQNFGCKNYTIPSTNADYMIINTGSLYSGTGALLCTKGVYVFWNNSGNHNELTFFAHDITAGQTLQLRLYYR